MSQCAEEYCTYNHVNQKKKKGNMHPIYHYSV